MEKKARKGRGEIEKRGRNGKEEARKHGDWAAVNIWEKFYGQRNER